MIKGYFYFYCDATKGSAGFPASGSDCAVIILADNLSSHHILITA